MRNPTISDLTCHDDNDPDLCIGVYTLPGYYLDELGIENGADLDEKTLRVISQAVTGIITDGLTQGNLPTEVLEALDQEI